MHKLVATSLAALLVSSQLATPVVANAQRDGETATPIKHLVVIFGENISFDHYFGTYPKALNPPHEPRFVAAPNTPTVNGYTDALLFSNPNLVNTTGNKDGASNPFRLDRSQAATADQDHDYTYNTTFGPSTPGAINLISGQTNGITDQSNAGGDVVEDGAGGYTLISDADPIGDVCSTTTGSLVQFGGQNVGDLLNAKGITWGFFEGGFDLTKKNPNGTTGCKRSHTSAITGVAKADYIPHHQPFQYYASTAN